MGISSCCSSKFGPTNEDIRSAEAVDPDSAWNIIKQHKAAGNMVGLIKFVDNQSYTKFAACRTPFSWV